MEFPGDTLAKLLANVSLAVQHGLPVIITLDVTDGLARDREAPHLVAAGRSITEPAVQQLYHEYACRSKRHGDVSPAPGSRATPRRR